MTTVTCPACQARLGAPVPAARRAVFCPRCEVAVPLPKPPDRGGKGQASVEVSVVRGFRVLLWLVCGVGQAVLVWAFWYARQQPLSAERETALAAGSCFHSLALFAAAGAIDTAVRLSLSRR